LGLVIWVVMGGGWGPGPTWRLVKKKKGGGDFWGRVV